MRKETSDDSTYVKTTITKWSTHPPMQKTHEQEETTEQLRHNSFDKN